jgi:hypothetical protein
MLLFFVCLINVVTSQDDINCTMFTSMDSCLDSGSCDYFAGTCAKMEMFNSCDPTVDGDDCVIETSNCESIGYLQCSYQPLVCYYVDNQGCKKRKKGGSCTEIVDKNECLETYKCDFLESSAACKTMVEYDIKQQNCESLGSSACRSTSFYCKLDSSNKCVKGADCSSFGFQSNRCPYTGPDCDFWYASGCGTKVNYSSQNCNSLGINSCINSPECIFDSMDTYRCYTNDCKIMLSESDCIAKSYCDYFPGNSSCDVKKPYENDCSKLGVSECGNARTPCHLEDGMCVNNTCNTLSNENLCKSASYCDWFKSDSRCSNYISLDLNTLDCDPVGSKECLKEGMILVITRCLLFAVFFFYFVDYYCTLGVNGKCANKQCHELTVPQCIYDVRCDLYEQNSSCKVMTNYTSGACESLGIKVCAYYTLHEFFFFFFLEFFF